MSTDISNVLRAMFYPKAVAVAGASADPEKWGGRILSLLEGSKFDGRVYPVNPKASRIGGRKCYLSVRDIPEPVDLVFITVPAATVPAVIADCAANGATVAQIISSGFSENGASGRALEQSVLREARASRLRLVGPNCMGIHSAAGRLSMTHGAHHGPGHISVISQSGGLANDFLLTGQRLGLRYSKIVSVGNCLDLDFPDFLQFLMEDEETEVIGLYIESSKQGQRLKTLLEATTRQKPVVLLKGGRTSAGTQSVSSHTGNLAGNYAVWQAMCRQTNVIEVKTADEFLSALMACQHFRGLPRGGVAIIGNGGGATVLACDICEELGLELALLSKATRTAVGELIASDSTAGNPIELPTQRLIANGGQLIADLIQTYCRDPALSSVVLQLNMGSGTFQMLDDPAELFSRIAGKLERLERNGKSVAVVLRSHGERAVEIIRDDLMVRLQAGGFPVFATAERALYGLQLAERWSRQAC